MSGSVKALLGAAVIIGVFAWLATQEEAQEAPRALSLAGFATAEQLEAEKNRGMLDPREEIPSPVDEIVIERAGEKIHLKRSGEGKDSSWTLLEPVKAKATRFQANKMVNLFKTETRSIYSTQSSDEELGLYDLEPERRIQVRLMASGELWNDVQLSIGRVQKSDSETAEQDAKHDTWVSYGDDPNTVYRVAGKDLRSAFEIPVVDLRDKAIFDVTAEQLSELRVTPPSGDAIVLRAIEAVSPAGAASSGGQPEGQRVWTLVEPAGMEADDTVSTLARSFAGLRTRAFIPEQDAPADALDGAVWKLEGKTAEGRELSLVLSAATTEQVHARASNVTELLSIDQFTAKNLRKGIADLRHRGLFKLPVDQLQTVTFAPEGAKPITVNKTPTGWRAAQGKRRLDVESLLNGLTSMKASRFARPDEVAEAQAALAKPAFTARLGTEGGDTSIVFGPKLEGETTKGQRWAAVESGGQRSAPALVQDHLAKRFRKTLDELVWKKLFDGTSSEITAVEILLAGEPPLRLERSGGAPGLALVAPPEGTNPVPAAINGIGAALSSARAKAFFPKMKTKTAGLGVANNLRVNWKRGQESFSLEISDLRDGQDPYARVTGGPLDGQIITLAPFQADKLRKKVGDLAQ